MNEVETSFGIITGGGSYIPFVHKSLQNYNDFVWTVTRLNGDMNYSLRRLGYRIRKPGPHNSHGSVGPLK